MDKNNSPDNWPWPPYPLRSEALRAAADLLAQPAPVQEPVAWMDVDEKGAISGLRYWSEPDNRHEVALYTTPPAAQPAFVQELVEKFCDANCVWTDHHPDCKLAKRTCDKLPQPQLEQP